MTTESKQMFVVLGMHRSGTSAITRGLMTLGIELGTTLLPPVENENAKGYFEDSEIFTLNVNALQSLDLDWDSIERISPKHIQHLHQNGFFYRAINLINRKLNEISFFGFKDPRTAKLLPFWVEVFKQCQIDVAYIIVIRNPLSVAESLRKRSDLYREKSYLLWLDHVTSSLSNTAGSKRVVVDYDIFLNDPASILNKIGNRFSLALNNQEVIRYQTEFLEFELRHSLYSIDDLLNDTSCPQLVSEMYSKLLEVSIDFKKLDSSEFIEIVEQWQNEFNRLNAVSVLGDKLTADIKGLEAVNKKLLEENANLKQSLIYKEETFSQYSSVFEKQLISNYEQNTEKQKILEHQIQQRKNLEQQLTQLQNRHDQNLILLHENAKQFYSQLVEMERSHQENLIKEKNELNEKVAVLNNKLQIIEEILLEQEIEKKRRFSFLKKIFSHKNIKVVKNKYTVLVSYITGKLKKSSKL